MLFEDNILRPLSISVVPDNPLKLNITSSLNFLENLLLAHNLSHLLFRSNCWSFLHWLRLYRFRSENRSYFFLYLLFYLLEGALPLRLRFFNILLDFFLDSFLFFDLFTEILRIGQILSFSLQHFQQLIPLPQKLFFIIRRRRVCLFSLESVSQGSFVLFFSFLG